MQRHAVALGGDIAALHEEFERRVTGIDREPGRAARAGKLLQRIDQPPVLPNEIYGGVRGLSATVTASPVLPRIASANRLAEYASIAPTSTPGDAKSGRSTSGVAPAD